MFLLAQTPAIALLDGKVVPAGIVWKAIALILFGTATSLVSPYWNSVLLGAWSFVAFRWFIVLVLGGGVWALVGMVGTAGAGYVCWRLGPQDNDWSVVPDVLIGVSQERAVARLRWVVVVVGVAGILPLLVVGLQASLIWMGAQERFYPRNIWIYPFVVALLSFVLSLIAPRPIRAALRLVSFANAVVFGVVLWLFNEI